MKFTMPLFFAACLILVAQAFAHDLDRIDATPYAHTGLDEPEFKKIHDDYWHCRRELQTVEINSYVYCLGAVNALRESRGEFALEGNKTIIDYWDAIPAHPVVDAAVANGFSENEKKFFVIIENNAVKRAPTRLDYARAQLDACEISRKEFNTHVAACNFYLNYLRATR